MASKKIHTLKTEITGDSTKLQRAAKEGAKSARTLGSSLDNLSSAVAVIDGPLGGITGRVSAFRTALTRTNALLGVTATAMASLTAATGLGVREFIKTEQSLLKTEALLRATGNATGFTAKQLDEMARATARATLASTDQIRAAQGVLLTFKSVARPEFERVIGLAQDMAAVFGGEAKTGATQLGKALEDPVTGLTSLRRTGISFTESQKAVIKSLVDTGNKAQAQAKILDALDGQIGGAGIGESGGLKGAFDSLQQASHETAEEWVRLLDLGPKLTRVVNSVTEALNKEAQYLKDKSSIEGQTKQLELMRQRLKIAEDLARAGGDSFNVLGSTVSTDLPALREQIRIKEIELSLLYEEKQLDDLNAQQAQKMAAINARQAAAAEAQVAADKKRAEALKDFLKIQESALGREQQEKALHLSRKLQFEEMEMLYHDNADIQAQVNSVKEAEELRHVEKLAEIRRLDDQARTERILNASKGDQALFEEYSKITESLRTATEAENLYHENRLASLEAFGQRNNELRFLIDTQIEAEKTRHEDKLTEIEKRESDKRKKLALAEKLEKLNAMSTLFGGLSALMDTGSKKMFRIGKMAAIANAIVRTAAAVTNALNGPPWPLNIAAAAGVAAAGAVQIAKIKSQQFGSGGTVTSPGRPNIGTPIYEPPRLTTTAGQNSRAVNLFIENVNGRDATELLEELRDTISDTDFVLIEGASANAQTIRDAA